MAARRDNVHRNCRHGPRHSRNQAARAAAWTCDGGLSGSASHEGEPQNV